MKSGGGGLWSIRPFSFGARHVSLAARCFKEPSAMKVNVEVECTPEEARRFLGLPDVSKANEAYVLSLIHI